MGALHLNIEPRPSRCDCQRRESAHQAQLMQGKSAVRSDTDGAFHTLRMTGYSAEPREFVDAGVP